MTSESLPTPDGSMIILSGWYLSTTSFKDVPKSPTSEQQIQPEFISLISTPESFKNPPSMPISPNSFSIRTTCSSFNASFNNLLIKVVFPAPKNPEIISTFVMIIFLSAFTASSNLFLIFYYTNAVNSPVPADKYKILIKYSPKYTESCEIIHRLNVPQLPPCLQSAPFHTGVLRSCNLKAGW